MSDIRVARHIQSTWAGFSHGTLPFPSIPLQAISILKVTAMQTHGDIQAGGDRATVSISHATDLIVNQSGAIISFDSIWAAFNLLNGPGLWEVPTGEEFLVAGPQGVHTELTGWTDSNLLVLALWTPKAISLLDWTLLKQRTSYESDVK